ncbi:SGNH/GDSL hydrolase family protein [Bifidobacterium callitrichos]|uniref:SGNH/GDSL hydrolase family protein n=1 Tax=Bifidobacterium callitrichos TaxID=762209 RepID=A0A5M9ZC97_9BIFI|nr:GDSL-type esterase/lipase family protein [Bifidobacterium callitrichos]KAA8816227.1 SGNH/GDSL hydrolase family protein [Bifidobacterium callitrichos]
MSLPLWERPIALAEALVAKHTVKLAPEPAGEREGLVIVSHSVQSDAVQSQPGSASDSVTDVFASSRDSVDRSNSPAIRPITLVTVGDSLTVGCGVASQSEGLTPSMAHALAAKVGRPVRWATHGKLGATMRRVRFRLLPEVTESPDLLVLCAGSNDLMARRSMKEWRADLTAAIDEAKALCPHVAVISSGQVYRSPALGRTLRKAILDMTDAQTAVSREICAARQVRFVDMTHYDTGLTDTEFWADDNFHPSKRCYQLLANGVIEQAVPGLADYFDKQA